MSVVVVSVDNYCQALSKGNKRCLWPDSDVCMSISVTVSWVYAIFIFFNEKLVKCQQIELSFKVKVTGPEAFQCHECGEKGGS